MKSVRKHYDEFLAPVYSWILGDFENAYRANVELFSSLELTPEIGDVAVDLGCGPGCQALPLAERGFRVVAIDFCQPLLDELAERAAGFDVRTVCDDLGKFDKHIDEPPALIVCMGDTLVHLPDLGTVEKVIDRVAFALKPGGSFVYSIRDYVSTEPVGAERFIPVRADDDQIFTCFLDYKGDVVHVHDVLYTRDSGEWRFSISDYLKLRLDTAAINGHLAARGLTISRQFTERGMIHVVATKPG
ncbi:MAG: class I SAM-dependent methyltransferase [Woeseiaceae bacterium]|nr:class I SAM-dependent methyltransferase [Woeseiaceae bacterium]